MAQTLALIAALASLPEAASIHHRTSTLASVCTADNIKAALPADGTLLGINLLPTLASATPVYNASSSSSPGMSSGMNTASTTYPFCNISLAYTHPGKNDQVNVIYAFPQPADFMNRFYIPGGGGYSLSSSATSGLQYGAASGATDAGYNAFTTSYDAVVLLGNGSIDWDATHAFGYQALGEMTILGKALANSFYSLTNDSKIYTYFEGCSDGGREGMSQVQRWGEEYDGVIAGAPAFRYAQQQVNHVFSSVVEKTLDYAPPPCALAKIVNSTIEACDSLDGRSDGVIARTDLCMLNFNLSSTIGRSYYCAGQTSASQGFGFSGGPSSKVKRQAGGAQGSMTSYQPTQNGTITAEDVGVAQSIYDGLHDSSGQRAYLSWQFGSSFGDAGTIWSNTSNSWEFSIPSTGGEFVTKFVQLLNLTNLESLDDVTYDTLVKWMNVAYWRYLDTLQTTIPDLTSFQQSGGKLLHYHGESDNSVPAASSVHYWQSVQSVMYSNASSNDSLADMNSWYQLYLVPGAAHCGANSLQPGPYPQNNMQTMIDWVENGVIPTGLNATVSSGTYKGETQMLCRWPTRPLWTGNTTNFDCVDDPESIGTWTYDFSAFKVPIY